MLQNQRLCLPFGVITTVLSIATLVIGFILVITFEDGQSGHWAGIGLLISGGITAILSVVYVCHVMHHKDKLWGCINISQDNSKLHGALENRRNIGENHTSVPDGTIQYQPEPEVTVEKYPESILSGNGSAKVFQY